MKRIIKFILLFYLIFGVFFYLPHLLTGSIERYGLKISPQLKSLAFIRDAGLIFIAFLIIFTRKGIKKIPFLFLIYILVVIIRLLLHGFSGIFLKWIIIDRFYIIGILVILSFFLVDWSWREVNIVKKGLKLSLIPIFLFFVWEFLNPDYAVYSFVGRFRSTLYSPTVLGQLSAILLMISLIDFVYSKKYKLANLIFILIGIILIFASGSRTSLLVLLISIVFLFILNQVKVSELIRSIAIIMFVGSIILVIFNLIDFDITSTRAVAIDIESDARLTSLINEWDNMTVLSFLIGSLPNETPPLDIYWFVLLTRMGIFGLSSFFIFNISILLFLLKKIRMNLALEIKNTSDYYLFIIVFMSFCFMFTTNLTAAFPLNILYWFSLGISMNQKMGGKKLFIR